MPYSGENEGVPGNMSPFKKLVPLGKLRIGVRKQVGVQGMMPLLWVGKDSGRPGHP